MRLHVCFPHVRMRTVMLFLAVFSPFLLNFDGFNRHIVDITVGSDLRNQHTDGKNVSVFFVRSEDVQDDGSSSQHDIHFDEEDESDEEYEYDNDEKRAEFYPRAFERVDPNIKSNKLDVSGPKHADKSPSESIYTPPLTQAHPSPPPPAQSHPSSPPPAAAQSHPSPPPPAQAPPFLTTKIPPKPPLASNNNGVEHRKDVLMDFHVIYAQLQRYYMLDILALILAVAVLCVAYIGKEKNAQVSTIWIQSILDILRENFATVGYEKSILNCRGYSRFELYCTGRKNCYFMHAEIQCMPRQCLWSYYFGTRLLPFISMEKDYVTLEFLLPINGECMCLIICRKKDQKTFITDQWDLCEFTKCRPVTGILPSNFTALSDTQESLDLFLLNNKTIVKYINAYSEYIKYIYYSDLCNNIHPSVGATGAAALGIAPSLINKKSKRILRIGFFLPDVNHMEDVIPVMRMALHLVDVGSQIQLSDRTREVVKKLRMAYEKEQQKGKEEARQEMLERKRLEKKRLEEEKMEKMDDIQKRKYEEQQYKKEIKAKRFKVKISKS